MESKCDSCYWWRALDGCEAHSNACLFCYLNDHSRRRDGGQCMEYKRREKCGKRVLRGKDMSDMRGR